MLSFKPIGPPNSKEKVECGWNYVHVCLLINGYGMQGVGKGGGLACVRADVT